MKFLHLSDLHLGKRLNEYSLLEDQKYILNEIIRIIKDEKTDAVLIAGDIYDKSVPSAEAVQLFDEFLYRLSCFQIPIFIISGNHDSAERMAFGARILNQGKIYIAPVYNGEITTVSLEDGYGKIHIHLLPFIKPASVRRFYPEEEIITYTDAIRVALQQAKIDVNDRNILLTHQFVTGAKTSESEEVSVGGSDNVDATVFDAFDYVALGHIHGPQAIFRDEIRYCGTPLKYSVSEINHKKSVTCVEIGEKGNIAIRMIPLQPLHEMRAIKGSYLELTAKSFYENLNCEDYIHITLTDEHDVPDAIRKLGIIYPRILNLAYDNTRTRTATHIIGAENVEQKTELELFEEFYMQQNGQAMSEEQRNFTKDLMEQIWEGAL